MNVVSRHFTLIAVLMGPAVGIALALVQGLSVDWDTRNYHLYNGYAFLTGRLHSDLAPAQLQTYFNPLLDIPLYVIYSTAGALAVTIAFAAVHGLQFSLLALIARRMLDELPEGLASLFALGLGLVGCLGVIFLYEVGGFSHDIIVAVAFLAALLAVIAAYDEKAPPERPFRLQWLLLAGLLMGAGAGAKYTGILYAVALDVALITVPCGLLHRLFAGAAYGLGVIAGIAVAAGFWMVTMSVEFNNPVFPLLGSVFPNELIRLSGEEPQRGFQSLTELLFAPIVMTIEPMRVGHFYWRDLRLAIAFIFLFMFGMWFLGRLLGASRPFAGLAGRLFAPQRYPPALLVTHLVIAVSISGLALWLLRAPALRYIAGIEAVVPLLLLGTLRLFAVPAKGAAAAAIVLLLACAPLVGYKDGRAPLGGDLFEFQTRDFSGYGGAMVIITGFEGVSFAAPFFPESTRFVRLQATVNWSDRADQTGFSGMRERARRMIAGHAGAYGVLYDAIGDEHSGPEPANTDRELENFGLRRLAESCRYIEGNGRNRRLTLCQAVRTGS